jgi:hypothetical protein
MRSPKFLRLHLKSPARPAFIARKLHRLDRLLHLDSDRCQRRSRGPHELATTMHQARAMQAREGVFYLDLIADFEHKLAYSPRALLVGQRQRS